MLQRLQDRLKSQSFDVLHRFPSSVYNDFIQNSLSRDRLYDKLPLELPGDGQSLLVGNTKSLWPHFIQRLKSDPNWLQRANPFDDWIEETLDKTVSDMFGPDGVANITILYGHRSYNDKQGNRKYVSLQTISHLTGFAALHKPSNLCIHDMYGPWIAFRAVITIVGSETFQDEPVKPCQEIIFSDSIELEIKNRVRDAKSWKDWSAIRSMISTTNPTWDRFKYSKDQLEYHYAKILPYLT